MASDLCFEDISHRLTERKIVFVDGGNQEILLCGTFSIHLIRAASITFQKNMRSKTLVSDAIYTIGEREEILPLRNALYVKGKDPCIIRKLYEIKLCEKELESMENGDILILDGGIYSPIKEEQEATKGLLSYADAKGVLVMGIVKSGTPLTSDGQNLNMLPKGKMWYVRDKGNIFVKLHPLSRHVFKIEIPTFQIDKADLRKVMGVLASNSSDPLFPGYPYGLIMADKMARASVRESAYFKAKILNKNEKELAPFISSEDSHDHIDSINNSKSA